MGEESVLRFLTPLNPHIPYHPTLSPPSSSLAAEGLLRGVDHVEEAVLVSLLLIDLGDGRGHGHHAVLVDQQEEGLCGVQLETTPGPRGRETNKERGVGQGAEKTI